MMAQYSVGITTLKVGVDSKTTQVYGLLFSGGTSTNWPASLTAIALQNGQSITSISATAEIIYNTDGQPTTTSTFGGLHSGGSPVPWSEGSTGSAVAVTDSQSPATSSSSPASTSASTSRAKTASTTTPAKTSLTTAPASTGSDTSKLASWASSPTAQPSAAAISSPSSGVSSGAAAGIAIGCLLIGLALGLLAAFLLVKRHGKRHGSAAAAAAAAKSGGGPYLEPEAAYNASDKASSAVGPASVGPRLDQFFLLQATPDRTIVQETQSISALIAEHVEGYYYHDQPASVDVQTLSSALVHLGFPLTTASAAAANSNSNSNSSSSLLDAQEAAALCLDPRSRRIGLRHVVTRVLLDSIDVRSPRPSLLPTPVATFLRAMPAEETDRFGDPQANALALREWRRLSAFLLHPSRSQRTALPAEDDAVAAQAMDLASSLNGFLSYFVEERLQQQVGHLRVVIEECARLGCLLFSHPSDWEFVYETGVRGIVVEAGDDEYKAWDDGLTEQDTHALEAFVSTHINDRGPAALFLSENTTVPVPHVHRCGSAPGDLSPPPPPGEDLRDFLASSPAEEPVSAVYEQLASYYRQLQRIPWDGIGAIAGDGLTGQRRVSRRPLTMDMHELALGVPGYPIEDWSSEPFTSMQDYLDFAWRFPNLPSRRATSPGSCASTSPCWN
ncbi:hypothetical protein ISF_04377 [Cordyceps fumosorosea ARSEF 2679]|uniref:Uncharacterized protein n=1 Tax=Cordyceps fumosorosea (strain ARSEF 2679) TaxID=1081104 RepID=A0A167XGU7_CORFA|nr:hypothetical protein ISF_04377 [Cordyceps fumosorosea ARSEF 2679]OAA64967.1 hypothetical protein ISF_04377 [Cordyceps fumosorosea ARSEF 2679]